MYADIIGSCLLYDTCHQFWGNHSQHTRVLKEISSSQDFRKDYVIRRTFEKPGMGELEGEEKNSLHEEKI